MADLTFLKFNAYLCTLFHITLIKHKKKVKSFKRIMKGNICSLCIALLCFLASCSEEEKGGEIFTPANYSVNGKVEKGPFIKGSTITLQPLDAKMNSLGTSFPGTIVDNEGTFDMGTVELNAPYALLTTNGYFYNELSGRLSDGTITLQAIVDLKDHSTVNVNLLTHLAKERIKVLIANGASFHDANKQAQKELLTNFGLQKYAEKDVAQFSITAGTNEAAALLVVSAGMLYDRSEAELTEYLAQLSLDFTANGKFTDEQIKEYRKVTRGLNFSRITEQLKERYNELGKEISIKDLKYFVDYDGNGIAGDEFNPDEPTDLAFEQMELPVPKEGGIFKVKFRANVPYSFTYPLDDDDDFDFEIADIFSKLFNLTPVVYEKQLDEQKKELTIKVKPAGGMLMVDGIINLYSMDGKIQSTLKIRQESDVTKVEDVLKPEGLNYFENIFRRMSYAVSYLHSIEGLYTKTYSPHWEAPVSGYNNDLQKAWAECYAVVREVCTIDNSLKNSGMQEELSFFLSYTATMRAALYYEMVVLWANMPYVDRMMYPENMFDTTNSTPELTFEKAGSLLKDRSSFADKKNDFSTVQNRLFVSKDVPAALLAKMYLYQREYSKALQLFEEIINSGYYELDSSRDEAMSMRSKEMIYGLPLMGGDYPTQSNLGLNDEFIPLVTYTEVLLSAAECAKAMQNEEKAFNYLNKVLNKKSLSSSGEFAADLKNAWQNELKGTGTYFAFLKRNDLALSELGFDSKFWLILPIPFNEIAKLPGLRQNPGY